MRAGMPADQDEVRGCPTVVAADEDRVVPKCPQTCFSVSVSLNCMYY